MTHALRWLTRCNGLNEVRTPGDAVRHYIVPPWLLNNGEIEICRLVYSVDQPSYNKWGPESPC